MPDERLLDGLSPKELWEHRGGIYYLRETPGVKRWIRLLRHARLPDLGDEQVTVLTGRTNRHLDDLGLCQPDTYRGRDLYSLVLDDPHPAEEASAGADLRRYLKRAFGASPFKRAFEAFLVQTYLHELGHARYCRSRGWRGPDARHEDAAERYAWQVMERLYDRETVLAALGLFWMFTGED